LSLTSPQVRALDLLHQAAYRTGLGNSLFIRKDLIGKINSETLSHYVRNNFTPSRTSIVALNVNSKLADTFGETIVLDDSSEAKVTPSPYRGGEIRKDKAIEHAHVAIATEGVGVSNQKEALAFAVLQKALGSPSTVKWGTGASPLAKTAVGDSCVAAINVSYSDSGLFGLFVSAPAADAGKIIESAVKTLKSGNVSEADVKRGKALLRAELLSRLDNGETLAEDLIAQSQLQGTVVPNTVLAESLSTLTVSDVSAAARKVANGKLSIGAIGNLRNVPYLDQLK